MQDLQLLVDQNLFAAAAVTGEKLLKQNPEDTRIMFSTAYAHQMSDQPDRAISIYQQIINNNPSLPEPRNNLAMIYLAQGDYNLASKLLVRAINTHPSYATAYENLSRIYKGIASEAYRRAVSESNEPVKQSYNIELSAITSLALVEQDPPPKPKDTEMTTVNVANLETYLIEQVKHWATAWSNKDFSAYSNFYSTQHMPNFKTHDAWLDYRRKRIVRPGFIKVDISNIRVRAQTKNRAIIDFRQYFDSPNYSDKVVKRLAFNRVGSQWKIIEEVVLSVL
jgi:hypothetical protein